MGPTKLPVIIDCDNTMGHRHSEIDDGLAILFALGHPELDLLGITTTHGNGPVDVVNECTAGLLARIDRPGVPLYPGAAHPGDVDTPAAHALATAAARAPGTLSVVAIGSLTNLLGAASLDPSFFENLRGIYCMGGYLGPLRFPRREVKELNFSSDPDAAHEVLNAPCPVHVMSAQLCLQARYGLRHLVREMVRRPRWYRVSLVDWFATFSYHVGILGFYLWDLLPLLAIVEPERFDRTLALCRSSRNDLTVGALTISPLDGPDAPAGADDSHLADPRAAGIITAPVRVRRPCRIAGDCIGVWKKTL